MEHSLYLKKKNPMKISKMGQEAVLSGMEQGIIDLEMILGRSIDPIRKREVGLVIFWLICCWKVE